MTRKQLRNKVFFLVVKNFLNRPRNIVILFVGTLLSAAAIFSLFESKSMTDSMWWAVVTSSTVGFGDIYPSTLMGRFFAGATLMFMSNFLITPLITAKMTAELVVNSDAFTHEEQELLKKLLGDAVAGMIASAARELETQALLTKVATLLEENSFTHTEQEELKSRLDVVTSVLQEALPLLRQIRNQTDELEDVLGVGEDEKPDSATT